MVHLGDKNQIYLFVQSVKQKNTWIMRLFDSIVAEHAWAFSIGDGAESK